MVSREKFEAWCKKVMSDDADFHMEWGMYANLNIRTRWEAWQASELASQQKLTDLAVQLANAESKCRELAAAMNHITELQSQTMNPVAWMRSDDITTFGPIFTKNKSYAVDQWGENAVALYTSPVNFKLACFTDERNLKYINERGRDTSLIWSERNSEDGDIQLFRAAGIGVKGE